MSQNLVSSQSDLTRSPYGDGAGVDGPAAKLEALLEGLLFVADEPVTVGQLAQAVDATSRDIELALVSLSQAYEGRGIRLQRGANRVQMVSAPETASYIERFLGLELSSRLSPAALEALTIVAYQQPVTRADIEAIRGVNSDSVLRSLSSKGLIEDLGRLDTVGRPIIYGTTFEFLQFFGLESLDQLPDLDLHASDWDRANAENDPDHDWLSDGNGSASTHSE